MSYECRYGDDGGKTEIFRGYDPDRVETDIVDDEGRVIQHISETYSWTETIDYEYDADGRVTKKTTSDNKSGDEKSKVVEYSYDEYGNKILERGISQNGDRDYTIRWEYDEEGRKIVEEYNEDTYPYLREYEYNEAGDLIHSSEINIYEKYDYTYQYNDGLLMSKTHKVDGALCYRTDYSYDERDLLIKSEQTYSLVLAGIPPGSTKTDEYTYDEQQTLRTHTRLSIYVDAGGEVWEEEHYDAQGRLTEEINSPENGPSKKWVWHRDD